jgi:hypothetical protein
MYACKVNINCPILIKFNVGQQENVVSIVNMKFKDNPFSGCRFFPCGQMDRNDQAIVDSHYVLQTCLRKGSKLEGIYNLQAQIEVNFELIMLISNK